MNPSGFRFTRLTPALVVVGLVWIAGGMWLLAQEARSPAQPGGGHMAETSTPRAQPSELRLPMRSAGVAQPRVLTDEFDHHGDPVYAACSTCHATREANFKAGLDLLPTEFHQGLRYSHGELNCLSCHNADNYDTLRRADGRALDYQNVMALCSQCHGPQTRDYNHGSHGGMVGFWDRAKGERERNRCIDCHDVHAPAYPRVNPVFPPRDRGALEQLRREQAHSANPSSHRHD